MAIKTVLREHLQVVEERTGVSCNVCGKEADLEASRPGWPNGFHVIDLSGGYGDDFPGDLQRVTFVVCCGCLEVWVKTFKDPDVFVDTGMDDHPPLRVTHTETDRELFLVEGWLVVPYPEFEIPPEAYDMETEGDEPAPNSVWQHYKGGKYLFHKVVFEWPSQEPLVLYQPLYGDSPHYVRPLSQWLSDTDEGVPRFRYVGPGE